MTGILGALLRASSGNRKNPRIGKRSKCGTEQSKPDCGSSGRSIFAKAFSHLAAVLVSGGLLGFPATHLAAQSLEVPGPIVEYPAHTEFRLIPVERTRDARFARRFFAEEGKNYLFDLFGRSFGNRYVVLAGRHRITGGAVPDLVLMVVPLDRIRYDPPEVKVIVLKSIGSSWRVEIGTWGYGTARGGSVSALVSPVVGVTYSGEPPDDIDPPFWVPPIRDGRRTIIWNDEGMFWNGSEWKFFCWRRCGERG